MTDTPERIFVAYAGDHMRYWGREPSPSLDCTEYRRADARPVPADDVEGLARALLEALDAVDAEAKRAEQPGANAWSSAPVVRMHHAREALSRALAKSRQ